jgi:integrase-like protein
MASGQSTAFKRTLGWSTLAEGRRIHDLRHTAACLWPARGVDPGTVQAWMGHASIATTNLYLHHLGTRRPGRSGASERPGARRGHTKKRRSQNDKGRTPPNLARLRWSDGVPVGWS